MGLVRWLAFQKSGRAFRDFERMCRDPEAARNALWKETLPRLKRGSFWKGKTYESLKDFPITSYADYLPTFQANAESALSHLVGESILFWAESSGTTGIRKLFPITSRYRTQFQSVNLPMVHGLLRRFPKFLVGKTLYFTSTAGTEITPAGVPVGYISGYNYLHTPAILAKKYALPAAVLRDPKTYQKWAPVYSVAANLTSILAITPARVRLLFDDIQIRRKEIAELLFSDAARSEGLPRIKIEGGRARRDHLRELLLSSREIRFPDLWPELEFIGCWKTSGCGSQLATLRPFLSKDTKIVDVMYSATEGWVNVPLENEKDGGPVHCGGLITEYLEIGRDVIPANLQHVESLEVGKRYEIFLTNTMGLVRYRLFDIVECTGFFHRSPVIHFVQKAGREMVLGMIRISEEQMIGAVRGTELEGTSSFLFSPNLTGDGIVLLIRGDRPPGSTEIQRIEEHLKSVNPYYKRDVLSGLLKPLRLLGIPENDALWSENLHAQTKPRLFIDQSFRKV